MKTTFHGPLAAELAAFLQFRRSLGYRYRRAEFTLRDFDCFLLKYVSKGPHWRLDQAVLAWLSSKPKRKAVSVSNDAAVLRQLFTYLRRLSSRMPLQEPLWPRLPTESCFVPYSLSEQNIRQLLAACDHLKRPVFRAKLYRALLLVLYCTGLRFGEALQLRLRDVDIRSGVLFVETFKGRARWVPFHRSLSRELERYLRLRMAYAPGSPDDYFFVGTSRRTLPSRTAGETLSRLFKKAGLKPARGRTGPRPYDFRHAFAVHRLSRWYRQGVDLHARLPWLSAYMGHTDIMGTETYLNATPELLQVAGNRLRHRYLRPDQEIGTT
jgi:integrase/recombinase XerD